MTEKRWKAQERRVAKHLGAKRNHSKGLARPDGESPWLVFENKDRARFPQWIVAALASIRAKAPPSKLPILTLTSPESPQILVVLDMRDFLDWFGKA